MLFGTPSTSFCDQFEGAPLIAGIDEAGRGPLAGPVVAAAVLLCKSAPQGLDDSKKLSEAKREKLRGEILASCAFGMGVVDVADIDRLNIFGATMLAMSMAMENLSKAVGDPPLAALIDGNKTPQGRCDIWRWDAEAIVGGDGIEASIGAASILAKTWRDDFMRKAAIKHPHYGWERNKGYGTKDHLTALREFGPTSLHRRSFAPVAQLEMPLG